MIVAFFGFIKFHAGMQGNTDTRMTGLRKLLYRRPLPSSSSHPGAVFFRRSMGTVPPGVDRWNHQSTVVILSRSSLIGICSRFGASSKAIVPGSELQFHFTFWGAAPGVEGYVNRGWTNRTKNFRRYFRILLCRLERHILS